MCVTAASVRMGARRQLDLDACFACLREVNTLELTHTLIDHTVLARCSWSRALVVVVVVVNVARRISMKVSITTITTMFAVLCGPCHYVLAAVAVLDQKLLLRPKEQTPEDAFIHRAHVCGAEETSASTTPSEHTQGVRASVSEASLRSNMERSEQRSIALLLLLHYPRAHSCKCC